jgi:BirA family biotin operon repressor/biotin-[acetyl-CoA-carboxylase] ligase
MPDDEPVGSPAGEGSPQATRELRADPKRAAAGSAAVLAAGAAADTGGPPAPGTGWRPFVAPERLDEVGSTNSELLARAAAGAPEGTVLLAERQLAGRGRLGRRWLDHPGGSILCSVLFRPPMPIELWYLAGFTLALAAIDACRETAGLDVACKWPNDLLAGTEGRKIAGVLAEIGEDRALVVGIGVNCNWPAEFPPEGDEEAAAIAATATSLDRVAGAVVDRDALAAAMLRGLSERWPEVAADPKARTRVMSEYRACCATIGRAVRVELPDDATFTGTAVDVDDRGRLRVDVGHGIRTVEAGDVVHVR